MRPITRTNYSDIISAIEILAGFQLADNNQFKSAIGIDSSHQFVFVERGQNGRGTSTRN